MEGQWLVYAVERLFVLIAAVCRAGIFNAIWFKNNPLQTIPVICVHGELSALYKVLPQLEQQRGLQPGLSQPFENIRRKPMQASLERKAHDDI